jgi:1-acyl-sn-glycerol-3-phosphate acyltransferase
MKNLLISTIYTFIIKPFLSLIIGVKFKNSTVLNTQKQFLIIANHNSYLDALALLAALPFGQLKNVHAVVATDYFGQNFLCKILVKWFFNAIFIHRNRPLGSPPSIENLDVLL